MMRSRLALLCVCRQWRSKRKDGGDGGGQSRLRQESADEEERDDIELDEKLDYSLPPSTRVSIRYA